MSDHEDGEEVRVVEVEARVVLQPTLRGATPKRLRDLFIRAGSCSLWCVDRL